MTDANNVELEDAMRVLRDHFGSRLDASRDEGQSLMADTLTEHLNIGKSEAGKMIDVLERAHTIEWISGGTVPDVTVSIPGTGQGVPIADVYAYWRLGSE